MGISEACYLPAGLAMIADYHSSATRSRAVAAHQSGMKTGQILGGFGGYIADSTFGWRAGFEWFGALGVGWGFFDANNMPILCTIVRPQLRATAFGILNMVTVFAGGWAVDRMGAMRDAGQPQSLMFNLCALGAAIAVVLVLLIKPKTPAN